MASTPTPSLRIEIPASGDYRGSWAEVMERILKQIDASIAGVTVVNTTGGTTTLTDTQYEDNQSRQAVIVVTGALGAPVTLVLPARSKKYTVINRTTGGSHNVSLKTAAGDAVVGPGRGSAGNIYVNSSNEIVLIGPFANFATGAITSTSYALLSALTAETNRATDEENTLSKIDGSRAFTGPVGGIRPTASAHLATKEYVDDVAGIGETSFVTTGSSSAYVVTTGIDLSLTDGLTISIRPHTTNAEGCTLNLDGKGAKPLRGIAGKSLPVGVAIQGTPYQVRYVSAAQEWLFLGYFGDPYNVPIGGFLDYVSTTPPNSYFVLPFGQAISRTTYAALFNLTGTTFGVGNGTTTFNLPDLRGRTVIGLDNMGGSAASRVTTAGSGINGASIGSAGGAQTVALARANLPNVSPSFTGDAVADHKHLLLADATVSNGSSPTSSNQVPRRGTATESSFNFVIYGTSTAATIGLSSSAGGHTPSGTVESLNGGVTQTAINKMPPAIVLPKLLRVI